MTMRRQMLTAAMSCAVLMALTTASLQAQQSGSNAQPGTPSARPAPSTPPAPPTFDPSRRVPRYFGQIGLTTKQRDSIYEIQGRDMKKIDELQRQIDELRTAMMKECEGVLTDTQRQLLEERRNAAPRPSTTRRRRGLGPIPAASPASAASASAR